MKIQCLLRRPGGTRISFDKSPTWNAAEYHFAPTTIDGQEVHLAEINHEPHINRLLSIPSAYRVWLPPGAQVVDALLNVSVPKLDGQATGSAETASNPETNPPPGNEAGTTGDAAADPAIEAIRNLSVRELKACINTYSTDHLRAALTAERESAKPRASWLTVVQAHLGQD